MTTNPPRAAKQTKQRQPGHRRGQHRGQVDNQRGPRVLTLTQPNREWCAQHHTQHQGNSTGDDAQAESLLDGVTAQC